MKDFKNTYIVPGPPEDVFIALTNPFTIELWTGYPAVMNDKPNTEFSLWDGDITGKNLEVIQNQKIVQEWYFGDNSEKSIVTISLLLHNKGCKVELEHINIPSEDFENITEGWNNYYFGSLIDFFANDDE